MKNVRLICLFVVVALLGGCMYTLVPAGKSVEVSTMTVSPGVDWSRNAQGETEFWTLDGPGLQELMFIKGAKAGDALFPVYAGNEDLPKVFAGMTAIDVADLYEATLARAGGNGIEIHDLRPYREDSLGGFRFEFDFLTADGLQKRGAALGTIRDDRVYMIVYTGTRIRYFDRGWPDVEHIFETVTLAPVAS